MNVWLLPAALVLIIIALIVMGPVYASMKPALDQGVASGGNATWLPYYEFQDAVLAGMKWISAGFLIIVAILGGIAILYYGKE